MVILYGDELSGKTSVVRYLARLAGRPLTVLAVTPSLDATDLLGSYEQVRKLNIWDSFLCILR